MSIPLLTYLSIAKKSDGTVTLNSDRLRLIRIKYGEICGDNDPDEQLRQETLKKLIHQLQLSDDQVSLEYLNICVLERTERDAELEIIAKFKGSVEFLEQSTATSSRKPKKPKKSKNQKADNSPHDDDVHQLNEIVCVVHKKLNKTEVNDFIHGFLFRQIQQDHPLPAYVLMRITTLIASLYSSYS
jgi:hypothetical protein